MKELIIYTKHFDLMLYAFPVISKYPRNVRFTLGQETQNCLLSLARLIIRANRERDRRKTQWELDQKLEELRLLFRFANGLKLLPVHQYGIVSEKISEIGKLLGGWMKSTAR